MVINHQPSHHLQAMRYHLMPEQRASISSNRTSQRQPEVAWVVASCQTISLLSYQQLGLIVLLRFRGIKTFSNSIVAIKSLYYKIHFEDTNIPILCIQSSQMILFSQGAKAYLFAIGGGSLFAIHSECEVYNPRTDRWQNIEPMEVELTLLLKMNDQSEF